MEENELYEHFYIDLKHLKTSFKLTSNQNNEKQPIFGIE